MLLEASGAEPKCSWAGISIFRGGGRGGRALRTSDGRGDAVGKHGFSGIQPILYCKIEHSGLPGLGAPVEAS